METLSSYEKYKDSGIEWIGEIPEHWEVKRFAFLFAFSRGLSITKQDLKDSGIPCVNYGEIHSKYGFAVNPEKDILKCVDEDYLNTSENALLKRGDFVFADTSEDIKGSGNFTCLDSDIPTFAGYHTIIARFQNKYNYKFLAYLFDSIDFRAQIQREVAGIKVFSITQAILKNTKIIIPTLKEQNSIAVFLSRKTADIDRIISNKQKLITLYELEKQTTINQVITKGLDPNVKTKDSGIEWFGEIPEHWEVKKLGYIGKCQNGINIGAESFGFGYPFVSYIDVYKNSVLPEQVDGLVNSTESDKVSYSVEEGDVFFTRTSETSEEIGLSSVCMKTISNATFAGFLIRFRPTSNILLNSFSKYYFRSGLHRFYFVKEMNLVTRASLSQGLLKGLTVLCPPLNEQSVISQFLDSECTRLNTLIDKYNKQIELLLEYRATLISEAVTGKYKISNSIES